MKKLTRKSISVLLSLLMALSVFGGLAFTASAADWSTSNSLPATAGSYKLMTDVALSSTWSPADGTTLDLNGHKITRNGTILSVGNGVTFTLEDSKKDSTDPADKHYYTTSRPATISSSETDSYFVGGYLTGARSAIAVVVESGGNFIMNGGTIFGNQNYSDAGGVRVYGNDDDAGLPGGVFTMNDGNIIGNYANWGGGLYLNGGSVFNLNGGSVLQNYAPNGGGGVLTWGTFNMSGGTVAKNSSIGPAGIYLFEGEFHLSGGTITGNTSSRDQGGLGGAAKTYISGNPVVTGNTSRGNTSNFNIPNGKTLTLEGALTEGASIQINTQANPNDGNPIIFVDGWGEYMGDEDPNDYFVSDNNSWQIILNTNGDLQITDPAKTYYTASFAAGEGSGDAPKSVTTAVALTLPENSFTAPDDNLFAGWLSGSDNTLYQSGESVTLTGDTAFTAQWVQAVHVTFEPENGSPAETVLVLPNTTVTAPEGWEKDEMALQGWRLGDTRFDFSTPVTEDITLHAIWVETVTDYDPADAGQIYADFQATAGSAGFNSNEDYPKLVDNNTSTKWCRGGAEGFIEFYSTEAFVPIGYSLTTANDTSSNSGRNPVSWTIQGKVNPGDGWTTIVSVENDTTLEARNYTEYSFPIDGCTSGFRYFRFAYSAVRSGNQFQLSELKFRGIPATVSTGHDLSFSAGENVLAANCSNDPCAFEDGKLELTLNAPAKTVYGDGNSEIATLTDLDRFDAELNLSISEDDIKYYNGETLLAAAPTDAGDYIASLTATIDGTDYTITKNYSIAKADPAYTAPADLSAVYGDTLSSVALPEGWAWAASADTLVGNAGNNSFDAIFTPADTANYNTATVSLSVAVDKAAPTYALPTELTALCGQTLADVELPDGWTWDDETTPVETVGADAETKDATYTATFTPADTANYNTASAELTVTVSHAYVNHDAKAPTCTAIGWDAYQTCENCDYTEYVEISAGGHQYGTEGSAYYTCTVCGAVDAARKAVIDQQAADAVIALIEAIGTVDDSDKTKTKIDAARTAYQKLTPEQKALVSNLATLEQAEASYDALMNKPCKYCGQVHDASVGGGITAIVHAILYFFLHLFGKR